MAEAKALFLEYSADLEDGDFVITSSGCTGKDMLLSPKAKKEWPFAIEGKNQESLNVWKSYEQAVSNAESGEIPCLIYKRNHSDLMISMKLEDFLRWARSMKYVGVLEAADDAVGPGIN